MNQVKSPREHEEYGRWLVTQQWLVETRERLGLTRTAMAELLHVAPPTYNRCEDEPAFGRRIWRETAERIGRFFYLTEITLDELERFGIDFSHLIPFHVVAVKTGVMQEVLMRWYRAGEIHAEDLGVLGLWVHQEDLHLIQEKV